MRRARGALVGDGGGTGRVRGDTARTDSVHLERRDLNHRCRAQHLRVSALEPRARLQTRPGRQRSRYCTWRRGEHPTNRVATSCPSPAQSAGWTPPRHGARVPTPVRAPQRSGGCHVQTQARRSVRLPPSGSAGRAPCTRIAPPVIRTARTPSRGWSVGEAGTPRFEHTKDQDDGTGRARGGQYCCLTSQRLPPEPKSVADHRPELNVIAALAMIGPSGRSAYRALRPSNHVECGWLRVHSGPGAVALPA